MPFNIAAAIDPTYHRRAHEFQPDETEAKVPVTLASSLPITGKQHVWECWNLLQSHKTLPLICILENSE